MAGQNAGLNEVLLSALGRLRRGLSTAQVQKACLSDLGVYMQTCHEHQEDATVCVISVLVL